MRYLRFMGIGFMLPAILLPFFGLTPSIATSISATIGWVIVAISIFSDR